MYHVRCYVFLFMAIALWLVFKALQQRFCIKNTRLFKLAGFGLCVIFITAQVCITIANYNSVYGTGPMLDKDQQAMIAYLRMTPESTVILNSHDVSAFQFVFSSFVGHRVYLEAAHNYDAYYMRVYPQDDRLARIQAIWSTPDDTTFCRLLLETPSTYVVEYNAEPFAIAKPSCLQNVWNSPKQEITVWAVVR